VKKLWWKTVAAFIAVAVGAAGTAQQSKLAATPPREWSTWNHFHHHISDALIIAGNDLAHMTDETKSILLNKEVIAVDQDSLGKQGDRSCQAGPLEVRSRPLSGSDMAVACSMVCGAPPR
jgi:hypothetical protein